MIVLVQQEDCQPGDVVVDPQNKFWQRGDKRYNWSTFTGLVGYYGEWKREYGPVGDLTLVFRDGQVVG